MKIFTILLLLSTITACAIEVGDVSVSGESTDENTEVIYNRGDLISSEKIIFDIGSIHIDGIAYIGALTIFKIASAGLKTAFGGLNLKNGVQIFSIVYSTIDPEGNPVEASGAVFIPDVVSGTYPLILLQHGTSFEYDNIPSRNPFEGLMESASGYVVAVPDYLGYGSSEEIFHPYLHANSYATAAIDMLRATRQYLETQVVTLNDKLFLKGYSEGGYATIALQKAIEEDEDLLKEFPITASGAGAGPYDLNFLNEIAFSQNEITVPAYAPFVFLGLNSVYHFEGGLEAYFNSEYITAIEDSYDFAHSASEISVILNNILYEKNNDDTITMSPSDLLTPAFLADYLSGGSDEIRDIYTENSLINWTPVSPTKLFHCLNDTTVIYESTKNAFDAFINNGALNIQLVNDADYEYLDVLEEPGSHGSCRIYTVPVIEWFNTF